MVVTRGREEEETGSCCLMGIARWKTSGDQLHSNVYASLTLQYCIFLSGYDG
jgi:microcystin-dependent protein